jgi:hypothetical protein
VLAVAIRWQNAISFSFCSRGTPANPLIRLNGRVAEWFKAPVLKCASDSHAAFRSIPVCMQFQPLKSASPSLLSCVIPTIPNPSGANLGANFAASRTARLNS